MGNTDKGSESSSSKSTGPNLKTGAGWERLISEYLSDLPRQLDSVRAILDIPNYEKIKQQAHRIKGTSGTYGLDTISRDAGQLEQSADTHDRENVSLAIGRIIKSVETQNIGLNRQSVRAAGKPERAANA